MRRSAATPALLALLLATSSCSDADATAHEATAAAAKRRAAARAASSEPAADRRADAAPDLDAALPAGAAVLVRIESIAALEGSLDALGSLTGAEELDVDVLSALLEPFEAMGDLRRVDRNRPLAVVVSFGGPIPMPVPTLLLPSGDPDALAAGLSLPRHAPPPLSLDGYVAVSQDPGYAPAEDGVPAIARDLPRGVVVARADLARIFETFGPMIESGLDVARAQVAGIPAAAAGAGPVGLDEIFDLYTGAAEHFLDSAEMLELALRTDGRELELAGSLSVKEGSALAAADWGARTGSLARIASFVSAEDPITAITSLDMAGFMTACGPLVGLSAAGYPPGVREEIEALAEGDAAVYELFGGTAAFCGGLGRGGVYFAAYYDSPHPEVLLEQYRRAFDETPAEALGMRVVGPEASTIAGSRTVRYRVEVDPAAMAAALGRASLPAEEVAGMNQALGAVFGPGGMRYTLAAGDGVLAIVFGGEERTVERLVAAATDPGVRPEPQLGRVLGQIGDESPAGAVRIDAGRLAAQVREAFLAMMMGDAMAEAPAATPPPSAPVLLWAARDGASWRFSASTDLEKLARLKDGFGGF